MYSLIRHILDQQGVARPATVHDVSYGKKKEKKLDVIKESGTKMLAQKYKKNNKKIFNYTMKYADIQANLHNLDIYKKKFDLHFMTTWKRGTDAHPLLHHSSISMKVFIVIHGCPI